MFILFSHFRILSSCDQVCKCPGVGKSSLPEPFAPFNFDSRAARKPSAPTMKMYLGWPGYQVRNLTKQSRRRISDDENAVQGPSPRRQQMWVGSPQKMLPPDGDYPGGRCAC